MRYLLLVVILTILVIIPSLNISCPEANLTLGNNRILIIRGLNGCFVITPKIKRFYKGLIHFRFSYLGNYILTITPVVYLGKFKNFEEPEINEERLSLNAVLLATFLAKEQLEKLNSMKSKLDQEKLKIESTLKLTSDKTQEIEDRELKQLDLLTDRISRTINNILQLEQNLEAFMRVMPGSRSLLTWNNLRKQTLKTPPDTIQIWRENFVN